MGSLVSYETTVPVGTTRGRFVAALAAASGLEPGREFFVCHSPERVSSGRVLADLRRYPKLVGGVDSESERRGIKFYEQVLAFDDRSDLHRPNGVWGLGSAEAAELTKLVETTYRDVNIALANEFAAYAEQIQVDFATVVAAANSQPFSHLHQPGIAVGGHCIPVYPHFYLAGDPDARLPAIAREINTAMPERAVSLLESYLGDISGATVAVLGAAYRGGVKETAFSGVFPVVKALEARGARAVVHDPLYRDEELGSLGLAAFHLGDAVDAAILQADHAEYARLRPADLPGATVVVDGRRLLSDDALPGVTLLRFGSPPRPGGRRR